MTHAEPNTTSRRLELRIAVVFALVSNISGASAQERIHEPRYAVSHIPGIGGGSDAALAMNDLGHIVGTGYTPDRTATHAIFWDGRRLHDLGTLGGNSGVANDVNNNDWVVGAARSPGSFDYDHAFLWKGAGDLIRLAELSGAAGSTAKGINDANAIVGTSDTPEATIGHAVLWEDEGTIIDLGTLEGFGDSYALDVNQQGSVVGWSSTSKGNRAFIYRSGVMTQVPGSLGDGEQLVDPEAMNDSLAFVGRGYVDINNRNRPFAHIDGKWYNLIRPITDKGFDNGTAWDINNANQIVGEINHEKTNNFFGFIAQQGDGIQILNDLIPPHCDYDIKTARAINEHGQIAANGVLHSDPNGSRMFLLTPIDPELTMQIPDGPLQADAINTLKITGAQAGATIKFFYGKKGGGKRIPGCDALAAMTQIDDPVAFGEAVADADGNAELEMYIPPRGAVHWGFLIQAVDFDNCEESQLVLKKVE